MVCGGNSLHVLLEVAVVCRDGVTTDRYITEITHLYHPHFSFGNVFG